MEILVFKEHEIIPAMGTKRVVEAWYGARLNATNTSHGDAGTRSKGTDVTEQARKVLRHGGELKADNDLFGDPADGQLKVLELLMEEGPRVYKEHETIPVMGTRRLVEAWYGARRNATASCHGDPGTRDKGTDVTEQARKILRDGGVLKADNASFGDPASGQLKVLELLLSEESRSYKEHETVPAMGTKRVVEAWYGARLNATDTSHGDAGTRSMGIDVTEPARTVLRGGGELKADNDLFGDPAGGQLKVLELHVSDTLVITGTMSGAWMSGNTFATVGHPHPASPGIYIFAVHDDGHTKMAAFSIPSASSTPVRIDGRAHVGHLKPIDASSIGATWESAPTKGVPDQSYKVADILARVVQALHVTGTMSGAWMSGNTFATVGHPHPASPGIYIFAVHDDGHTKMAAFSIPSASSTPVRIDGRAHVGHLKPIDASSIGATWESAPTKGVPDQSYKVADFRMRRTEHGISDAFQAVNISDPVDSASTSSGSARLVDFKHVDGLAAVRGVFDDASNPLVSLDTAIARQSDNLDADVWSAKNWARLVSTKGEIAKVPRLSADMAMAIWLYTAESPLYVHLNATLRTANRQQLKAEYFPFLRLLLTALRVIAAAANSEPRMINRGVKLDLVSMQPDVYVKGETTVWWSFSSCTTEIDVLSDEQFLGTSGDRTIFQVHTRRGVGIAPFSAIKMEAEVLLPPGTPLTITGVLKTGDGLTIVTCEDDKNAPELIK